MPMFIEHVDDFLTFLEIVIPDSVLALDTHGHGTLKISAINVCICWCSGGLTNNKGTLVDDMSAQVQLAVA